MGANAFCPKTRRGRAGLTVITAAAIALFAMTAPAAARGPEGISDVAEQVIDAVVNVSTKQSVDLRSGAMPQLPPGSPFEEFFEEFFKNRRGQNGQSGPGQNNQTPTPRRVNSLGSGFIIDPSGVVVTNSHVISEADEVSVILNDGTTLKAEVIGRDQKTDLALLKVTPTKPLKAVKFGDSDKLRLGEWVIAIGNPFSLGGTVTAGIVSARNRDIQSGPYDNYIQTDASINRGNSGGPLFNLNGEVIGVNTAIISPSGGSIGIGFAVPSKTVVPVVDQLREFKEVRRGWLGVRIQQVSDEIAESLEHQASARCARGRHRRQRPGQARRNRAGRCDRQVRRQGRQGNARPAEDRCRHPGRQGCRGCRHPQGQRGKEVGQAWAALRTKRKSPPCRTTRRTRRLKQARGEEGARPRSRQPHRRSAQEAQHQGQGERCCDHRCRCKFAGVGKAPCAGMVIAEVQQQPVSNATELQQRIEKLKKDGKKAACCSWCLLMGIQASSR